MRTDLESTVKTNESLKKDLKKSNGDFTSEHKLLIAARQSIDDLTQDLSDRTDELNGICGDLEMQKNANADLLNDYDMLKEKYDHLQTEKSLLENFNAKLDQEFAGAQQQVADVYAVVEDRDRLIADLGLELSTAVEGAETFQSDYDVLTENFNEVKAERSNFNTEISKLKIELAKKEKTITNQENSIAKGNSEIKNSKAAVQELQVWKQESINETLH
jgi:chromosome segregation ATPase